jgi:hypothetical protein
MRNDAHSELWTNNHDGFEYRATRRRQPLYEHWTHYPGYASLTASCSHMTCIIIQLKCASSVSIVKTSRVSSSSEPITVPTAEAPALWFTNKENEP